MWRCEAQVVIAYAFQQIWVDLSRYLRTTGGNVTFIVRGSLCNGFSCKMCRLSGRETRLNKEDVMLLATVERNRLSPVIPRWTECRMPVTSDGDETSSELDDVKRLQFSAYASMFLTLTCVTELPRDHGGQCCCLEKEEMTENKAVQIILIFAYKVMYDMRTIQFVMWHYYLRF